jgi:hypothetical protein
VKDDKYIAETNAKSLGKVSVGKSCIRFKSMGDVELDELKRVIKEAGELGGMGQVVN